VDTPVRGMVYEASGTLPRGLLREGAAAVRKASLIWQMPIAIVEQPLLGHDAWVAAMVAGVDSVLSL
jgi:hypothetical protein